LGDAAAEVIRSAALAGVAHGFLNAGQSDARRFELVSHRFGPVEVKQVHSAAALIVDAPFTGDLPEADALVTATPGLALAIRTADCAPVLLADRTAGVVAAAHAGWRGAVSGVLEATVVAMAQLGATPANIIAAVGPTIARYSYEVDEAFRARLVHGAPDNARFFASLDEVPIHCVTQGLGTILRARHLVLLAFGEAKASAVAAAPAAP